MAVSSVAASSSSSSSSSSSAWPSVSCFSLRRNFKLTSSSWNNFAGRRDEMYHLAGITGQIVQISSKPKEAYVSKRSATFASSEGETSFTELDSITSESEKFQVSVESYSLDCSSSILTERNQGKAGFISFYNIPDQRRNIVSGSNDIKEAPRVVWLIGPTILVAFLVLPSLYLRKLLSIILEDSLLTDFLILFFTEALFYGGVAIFVLLVHLAWRPSPQVASKNHIWRKTNLGFRISSVATLVLSLIIPLLTMGMVWPWTGPAASATLAPYLVGLVVQFAFEQYACYQKTPAWPIIPVVFQVYRLHQLNRAAQLVTALTFSVRGAETTSQTLAITNSLGTLLTVLQILGVICIWSLSSFLMRFLPPDIPES